MTDINQTMNTSIYYIFQGYKIGKNTGSAEEYNILCQLIFSHLKINKYNSHFMVHMNSHMNNNNPKHI